MSSQTPATDAMQALVLSPRLDRAAHIPLAPYAAYTERHVVPLPQMEWSFLGQADILGTSAEGVILLLEQGLPSAEQLALTHEMLARRKSVFFYWPAETAIEVIDDERYRAIRLHCWAMRFAKWLKVRADKKQARLGNAGTPHYADTLSVRSTAQLMGQEVLGLDSHLKGGVAELRRGLGAISDQFAAHTNAVSAQLRAAAAAGDADAVAAAIAAAQAAVEGASATIGSLRAFGDGIANHIEGGFPVIERLKSQAATAASDVMRIDLALKR